MTGYQGTGMWADPDSDPRESVHDGSGEKDVLNSYLEHYRMTFEMKLEGLTAEQVATRSVPPSTMSLLGLLRHLAKVEHAWFRRILSDRRELPKLFVTTEEPGADFDGAVADDEVVAEAWTAWRREVDFAREWYAGCGDLGAAVEVDGEPTEVRDIIVHMIEEYARHCGHADLLRECIDGRTGQ